METYFSILSIIMIIAMWALSFLALYWIIRLSVKAAIVDARKAKSSEGVVPHGRPG